MEIFLKKEIIENKKLTEKGVLVYTVLRGLYNSNIPILSYSTNLVFYILKDNIDSNQRQVKSINDGLNELIDIGLVSVLYEDRYSKILDLSKLYLNSKKDYFILVDLDNIRLAYSIGGSKLLRYYLVVLGSINSKTQVGTVTIDLLSQWSGISRHSGMSYNKLLEDNGLLYICRTDERIIFKDGGIQQVSNAYGRIECRDLVDAVVEEYRKGISSKSNMVSAKSGDEKRSIKMMYNNFVKGSKKWKNASVDEINELIEECKRYNECFVGKDNMKLDLSVFEIEDNNDSVKNKNNSNNSHNDECWGKDTFN